MTEKLELKHLSPYLPYGLKVQSTTGNTYELSTYNRVGGSNPLRDVYTCLNDSYKPILRPLSDLINEITHNGETFVPIDWLNQNKSVELIRALDSEDNLIAYNERMDTSNIRFFEYCVVEKMFEWHVDVFGLIDKGLAVSIHDMESAPNLINKLNIMENRVIKFRGLTRSGKWLYGDLNHIDGGVFIFERDSDSLDSADNYEVKPETVGQFTGLLDKNGREIYKMDVIEDKDGNRAVVVWIHEWAMFGSLLADEFAAYQSGGVKELDESMFWSFPIENSKVEVIGNIYENPELWGLSL